MDWDWRVVKNYDFSKLSNKDMSKKAIKDSAGDGVMKFNGRVNKQAFS